MTRRSLSENQIRSLKFQKEHLYDSLAHAVINESLEDAKWLQGVTDAYEKSLLIATNYSAFMDWTRTSARTEIFDTFLLPFAITYNAGNILYSNAQSKKFNQELSFKETDVTSNDLLEAIDSKVRYSKLMIISSKLTNANDFDGIVRAFDYVR